MRIHLVFPTLPPDLDGIGDYTARMASTLAASCEVAVLTHTSSYDAIPGVSVRTAFPGPLPGAVRRLPEAVAQDPPDWLVVQYNPFSYGPLGFTPYLPYALRRIKHTCPPTRIAVMVHEAFVPVTTWKFALMTGWQRWQLWMLGRSVDRLLVSTEPWAHRFQRWFPELPVQHMPVGSNMPRVAISRADARRRLGLAEDTLVIGVFGSMHRSRLLSFVQAAAHAIGQQGPDPLVLYVGAGGATLRRALGGVPLHDAGPLDPGDVSRHLAAVDLYLAPFLYGVSSRRGSFMAGLQHGLPTVSTAGPQTDAVLQAQHGRAFLLADYRDPDQFVRHALALYRDADRRRRCGEAAAALFEERFSWPVLADHLLQALTTDAYHPA